MAYYVFLVAGIHTLLALGVRLHKGESPRTLALISGDLLISFTVGVLLSAPQLLPTYELVTLSQKSAGIYATAGDELGFRIQHLALFVDPDRYGTPELGTYSVRDSGNFYWELACYIGLSPLLVTLFGVRDIRNNPRIYVHLLSTAIVVLFLLLAPSLGASEFLASTLPGYKYFRLSSRLIFFIGFIAVVAFAHALNALLTRTQITARQRRFIEIGILGVGIVDLHIALSAHNPRIAAGKWVEPPGILDPILQQQITDQPEHRIKINDPQGKIFAAAYRNSRGWSSNLGAYDAAHSMVYPNIQAIYGVPGINARFPLTPRWLDERLPEFLYDVRYFITPLEEDGSAQGLPLAAMRQIKLVTHNSDSPPESHHEIGLYEHPGILPRAFLVSGAVVENDLAALMSSPNYRPDRILTIDRLPADGELGNTTASATGTVEFEHYGNYHVRMAVDTTSAAWVFLSDTYYPGWKASIDGVETPIYRANIAGRAVRVPEGRHTVEFNFHADSFYSAIWVSLVGCMLLLMSLFAPPWFTRRIPTT